MTSYTTKNQESIATVEFQLPLSNKQKQQLTRFRQNIAFDNFFQSAEWLNAIEHDSPRLIVSLDGSGEVIAHSLLTVARSRLHLPEAASVVRGPLAKTVDAMRLHLRDLLDLIKDDYASIRINPTADSSYLPYVEEMLKRLGFQNCTDPHHYQHTVKVPVQKSTELQWRSIRRSLRTAINKANRLALSVTHDTDVASYNDFIVNFSRFAKSKGIAAPHSKSVKSLQRSLSKDRAQMAYLVSARSGGHLHGQMLLVNNTTSLAYEWGWSESPSGQPRVPVMHSLVWKALEICRDRDIPYLDLGGYWIERGREDPNNHFKLGFSKSIEKVSSEYQYVFSKSKHMIRQKVLGIRAHLKWR